MSNDLNSQLRALVDAVAPVSSAEAIERAKAHPGALAPASAEPLHNRRSIAIAASVVVLSAAGVGSLVAARSGPSANTRGAAVPKSAPKAVLTSAEVRAIAAHSSSAAAASGTAEIIETSAQDGSPQGGYDTAVSFSGQNIDEKITSVPEPPGSSKSFTTDDRFVGGEFYIYTPGPGDVPEWLHDTNSAADAASMQFPDPRTLYGAISPGAQFSLTGTSTMNGATVTHLIADDTAAINTAALGNLADGGTVTSFSLWVDANDVVRQVELSTTSTDKTCRFDPLKKSEMRTLLEKYRAQLSNGELGVKLPAKAIESLGRAGDCGPMTTTSNVMVTFANLGVPQSVVAPLSAVDYSGKG